MELYREIQGFLEQLEVKKYSENTIKSYEINLRYFYSFCNQKEIDYKVIKGSEMNRYIKTMTEYRPSTINLRLSVLRSFYDYEIDNDMLRNNPVRNSLYIRTSRAKPKPLSREEEEKFLKHIEKKDEHIKIAFVLLLETGIRISELTSLREEDFFKKDDKYYIELKNTKNKEDRVIPLKEKTYKIIKQYIKENIFSGRIFTMTNRAYQYHAEIFERDTDIKFSVHSLRHTFATRLSEKKVPLQLIQKLLGHKNINTTMYYVQVTNQDIYEMKI